MNTQYTLPENNPNGCPGFEPHPWRPNKCVHCTKSWNLHCDVTESQAKAAIVTDTPGQGNEVYPGIYLGGFQSAMNRKFLKTEGITAILTAACGLEAFYPNFGKVIPEIRKDLGQENSLQLELLDSEIQDLTDSIPPSVAFIEGVLSRNGKVLVHCAQGKSRSTSMIIAFLVQKKNMTYDESLTLIHKTRPTAQPNPSFEKQLRKLI
eukprot:Lithocolla_globosa_v1_NODE_8828_length_778_cov_14.102351.p1 type:complete len:207 gc:universal NODE_8828_length_778_cov_14.102351:59-679(+)